MRLMPREGLCLLIIDMRFSNTENHPPTYIQVPIVYLLDLHGRSPTIYPLFPSKTLAELELTAWSQDVSRQVTELLNEDTCP